MADSAEKVLICDRGNLEFLYPRKWSLDLKTDGRVVLIDPSDSCRLEVSYFCVPLAGVEPPPLTEFLRDALRDRPPGSREFTVVAADRTPLRLARGQYQYDEFDRERGQTREANARVVLASNGLYHALLSFYYWTDDGAWAAPAFERILETLALGDGTQLDTPFEHWSLKPRS